MVSPGCRLSHSLKSSGKALPLVKPSCCCVVPAVETWDIRVPEFRDIYADVVRVCFLCVHGRGGVNFVCCCVHNLCI